MNNRYLKSAIISSSVAVVTGVLLFGINATFGAPTYQPPGADVSPTFSGVNVNGSVKIAETNVYASPNNQVLNDATGGMLTLKNDPVNSPRKGIFMDGDDIVAFGQSLYLNVMGKQQVVIGSKDAPSSLDIPGGYIRNSNNGSDPVTIFGIKLPGGNTDLDVASSSSIKNSTGGFPVDVSDPDGLKLSAGNLDMQNGVIKNSTGNNSGNVKIDDALDVTSAVATNTVKSYSGGTINVNNALDILGSYLATDSLKSHTGGGSVNVDSPLKINKQIDIPDPDGGTVSLVAKAGDLPSYLTLTGSLQTNGDIISYGKIALYGAGSLFMKGFSALGTSTFADIDATGKISNSVGDVSINDNLAVTGKVTATGGFGTYTTEFNAAAYSVANAGFASKNYACNAGGTAVSCFVNSYSADPGTTIYSNESGDMQVSGLYIYGGTCWANFKNNSGSTKYFKVGAVCYNPKL